MKTPRAYIIGLIILSVGFAALYAFIYDAKIDLNGDNASYYILGKALHAGEGYVSINSVNKSPNNHFPPGYPLLLSLLFFISDAFIAVKLLNALFLFGALIVSALVIRTFSDDRTALICLPFLLVNAHLLKFSTMMMTEVPFLFFSMLSFWFFLRGEDRGWKYYALAFICFMVSFYIRTLGIAILAAYGLVLLFDIRKRWKILAAYIGGFVVLFLPWFLRGQSLGGNSYVKQLFMINPYRPEAGAAGFADLITRFMKNAGRYVNREIPEVMFPFKTFSYKEPVEGIEWLTGGILVIIILLGLYRLTKYRRLLSGYLLATFAVLLLWPDVWVGIRFVLPTLPFLVLLFIHGITTISQWVKLRWNRTFTPWLALLLLIPLMSEVIALNERSKAPYEPKWQNYFNVASALKAENKPHLVISCRKPSLFYLYSGTYTTRYAYTLDPDEFLADLEKRKVDYVVLEQLGYSSTYRYLLPAIQNNPDRFERALHLPDPDTYLLRFIK